MSEKSEPKSTSKPRKPRKPKVTKEPKTTKEKKATKVTKKVEQKSSARKEKKMKTFTVTGKFVMGDSLQEFQKSVNARGEKRAREKIYQDLGSKHRVRRSRVLIDAVEEAK
jgi:large subunit ribosomal protein LX